MDTEFETSFWVLRGNDSYSVQEIASLADIRSALDNWPYRDRDRAFRCTYSLVQMALQGRRSPLEARNAFVTLASRAGILVTR